MAASAAMIWLALKVLDKRLPWQQVGMTSFIAWPSSNTLGFALLTGSSVRYRLYSSPGAWHRGGGQGPLCSITFFLGLLAGGSALLLGQGGGPAGGLAPAGRPGCCNWRGLALLTVLAHLVWPGAALVWRGHPLFLPRIRYRLLQLLIAPARLDGRRRRALCAAAIGQRALSGAAQCLRALQPAWGAGPCAGGIGVFEASMSLLLTHYLPVDKLLASCLSTAASTTSCPSSVPCCCLQVRSCCTAGPPAPAAGG